MKVYKEVKAKDFQFWGGGGAVDTVAELDDDQLCTVWYALEESAAEPMTKTDVNDFFWFDRDTIGWWLGYKDWEDFLESKEQDG